MAGIGFALQKLLTSKSLAKRFYAFIIATFISSGPWLFSMISLILINLFSSIFIKFDILLLFRATVIYVYALSIVSSGPVQYLLTKYLADQYYIKKFENFYPALLTSFIIQFIISCPFILLWYILLKGAPHEYIIGTFIFYLIISYIWLMMDFLSASKQYLTIVYSFFIGSAISVILALIGAFIIKNTVFILYGFTFGQLIILLSLFLFAGKNFKFKLKINFEFLNYFKKYPLYLIIGCAYNLGLWTDKILIWLFKGKKIIYNLLVYEPYDFMIFFSYLSIIPALAVFLMKSETSFYLRYHRFYRTLTYVKYSEIENNFNKMKKEVYRGILILLLVQIISAMVFYFIANNMPLFKFCSWLSLPLIFASSFQVMFLFTLVYLMYFDFIIEAAIVSVLFASLNFVLTLFQLLNVIDFLSMGYSYFISTLTVFIITILILIIKFRMLIYQIFKKQIVL